MTGLPPTPYEMPDPPDSPIATEQSFESYKKALAMIGSRPDGIERLSALLTEVSAKLQQEATSTISQTLLAYASNQDRPVLRSTRTVARSPQADRAVPTSRTSPSAIDLLASQQRMGPRLASKLVLAEARRQARSR